MNESDTPKRKHPSGAQKRRARRDRELALTAERQSVSERWLALASSSYPASPGGFSEHTELPVYGVPPARSVHAITSALAQLEQGVFTAAAILGDQMLRDDRIYGTLGVRINGLIGQRLDLEPALDTIRARRIKEDCEEIFTEVLPLTQIGELLRWGILLGIAIAQVIYKRDGQNWCPTIKVWHPRYLRFDWLLRRYRLITQDAGEITIDPDDPSWIIYEPYGPIGWLRGAIRALGLPYIIRHFTRQWWSRYCEVHGGPIRAGIVPENVDPADEKLFLSQLSSLGHEAAIRLRQGQDGSKFDVKLIEAQANTFQGFQALLAHVDDSIAICLLGQRSSTSGASGLGSDANPGDAVRIDIKRSDALIGDCLRDQVLKPWSNWNYGNEDLAPYIRWQIDPPEDLAKKALELSTLGDAIQKLKGSPVDIRAVLETFNLPLLDEDEAPPDIPGTPDPLPQPSDEDDGDDENADGADDQGAELEIVQSDKPAAVAKLSARLLKLSDHAKQGDAYSLALSAQAKKLAAKALGPDLARVKREIELSSSPADLRKRLRDAFKAMKPDALASLTSKALVMANLAGRAMVHGEVKK